ncbi:uncharacterized protein LOC125556657 [Nematostella vectensis]|uniref:uncharacterized protein LOC125556657 n=1 Tax=Nematostella vectensis TaxID=45351 RepID=UPI0020774857|nr:uncharacterized protein LOC125556657 [Nematostella vectensis]
MCGTAFSKFLSPSENKAKVKPLKCYSRSSLNFEECDSQQACNPLACRDSKKKQKSNQWTVFQIPLKPDEKGTGRLPKRMEECVPKKLTKEMLLNRQAQAELNRQRFLDTTKQKAQKSSQCKCEKDEQSERMRKALQISQKQARAEMNRRWRLEQVRDAAKHASGTMKKIRIDAQFKNQNKKRLVEMAQRKTNVDENRQKIVQQIIDKQQRREERARAVREKAKTVKASAYDFKCDEVDLSFYASDSDDEDQELWDKFWGIHKDYQHSVSS